MSRERETRAPSWEEIPVGQLSPRLDVLGEAGALISGDRNNSYGEPTQDFQRTAATLNALGYRVMQPGQVPCPLEPHDVAIIMCALKLSRLMWTPGKRDSWVDLAGYAACGYETATLKEE